MIEIKRNCVALAAVLCLGGCGPETVEHPPTAEVTGKVTLDGKALGGVQITFTPVDKGEKTFPARATSNEDGTYELYTYFSASTDVAGALPGKYKVTVYKPDIPAATVSHGDAVKNVSPSAGGDGHGDGGPENVLPAKYQSPSTTDIDAEVKADTDNEIPIELKSE